MGLFFVVIIVSITNRKRKMLEININARFAPGELMEELDEILDSFPSKLFHPKWYVKKWHLIFIFTWNIIYFIYPDHVQVQAREHGQALLECSVTGKPAPSVTWYKDGQPLVEVSKQIGVKVRNMKMDFNIYGTWRQVGQWTLMMKIYDFFFIRLSHLVTPYNIV